MAGNSPVADAANMAGASLADKAAMFAPAAAIAPYLAQSFQRGLGMIAHWAAPAPAPAPKPASGAQAAATVVPDALTNMSKLVEAAQKNPALTFPQMQALTGMVPLYNHPLDAKNQAAMRLLGVADAIQQAQMAAAGADQDKQVAALQAYQENLSKAMAINPMAEALGLKDRG